VRGRNLIIIAVLVVVATGCALRPSVGRTRPDLAAAVSFDDGPLTFSRTYNSGEVGPFTVGESRSRTRRRLASFRLLEQDQAQLNGGDARWTVALPAQSGGYSIYTLTFEGERLTSVKAFYSLLAGL
jgi:hypothetical protein